jgi:hypothetical protein
MLNFCNLKPVFQKAQLNNIQTFIFLSSLFLNLSENSFLPFTLGKKFV